MVGDLISKRKGHGVIYKDSEFWIVGGQGTDYKTERCKIDSDQVICSEHGDEVLNSYSFYPGLFNVPYDFCL